MDQEDELHSVYHASLHEFVYEDELLPEIDIREMISLEQMMQYNPSFVALSFNDIVSQMAQLLSVNVKNNEHVQIKNRSHTLRRAQAYAKLHDSIINPTQFDFTKYLKFCVDADKKKYNEDGTGNDESAMQFVAAYTNALKAPSYTLQQIELNKVFTPFYVDESRVQADGILTIQRESSILLKSVEGDNIGTKVIDSDNMSLNVTGALWNTPASTASQYVFDSTGHNKQKTSRCIPWFITRDSHVMEDWIETRIRPNFEDSIKKYLKHIGNTHELELVLSSMGKHLADLGIDDFNKVVAQLETINSTVSNKNDDNDDIGYNDDKRMLVHFHKFTISKKYSLFADVLSSVASKHILSENTWSDKKIQAVDSLREACANYIIEAQQLHTANVIHYQVHPHILAQATITNQVSLDEIIGNVKAYFSKVQIERVKDFMDNMQQIHNVLLTTDQNRIDKFNNFLERLKQTKDSINIANSSIDEGFIKTWKDMSEILQGSDTSNYDGSPLILYESMSEDQLQIDFGTALNDDEYEESDLESVTIDLLKQFPTLSTCNEGALEVMMVVIPTLLKIRNTSGLPWSNDSVDKWIHYCSSTTLNRQSRAQQLKTIVDDISLIVARGLCASTEEATMYKIRQMSNTQLSEQLLRIYPNIHAEWKLSCLNTLTSGMVEFWLECLEKSVKGMLDFSILNGIVSLVNVWSPYGLPLDEKDGHSKRNTQTGVVMYISEVAKMIKNSVVDNDVPNEKDLLLFAETHHQDRINALKLEWSNSSKTVRSKAELSKISLIGMIEDIKAKRTVNDAVVTYVNAFLYLPNLLPKSDADKYKKQAVWGLGCCTAHLNAEYKADVDWKNNIVSLWKIKQSLAKDRWITQPRKHHALFIRSHKKSKDKQRISHSKTNNINNWQPVSTLYIAVGKDHTVPVLDDTDTNGILSHEWVSSEDRNTLKMNPSQSTQLLLQIVNKICTSKQSKIVTMFIESVVDSADIIRMLSTIAMNLTKIMSSLNSGNANSTSIFQDALDKIKIIKKTISRAMNNPTAHDAKKILNYSKYMLAIALCLPALPQRNNGIGNSQIYIDQPPEIPSRVIPDLVAMHVKSCELWNKTHAMLSTAEIQDYINKIREEQKNVTLAKYNVLNVDDLQLMKDMKRIGLHINDNNNVNNVTTGTDETSDDTVIEVEGESEFMMPSLDRDTNEDVLDG